MRVFEGGREEKETDGAGCGARALSMQGDRSGGTKFAGHHAQTTVVQKWLKVNSLLSIWVSIPIP